MCARIGGEEFAVIMPATELEVVARLQRTSRKHPPTHVYSIAIAIEAS